MGDALEPRKRAVFARHAASLLVIRTTEAGPEVLMGVRGAGHRFMPNRLVFPGGSVDKPDGVGAAATEPSPALLGILGHRARPRLARALAVCAARELEEETGLSLGHPPRLHRLDYLCRAVTPPESPIRFNARFLLVPAEETEGVARDSVELSEVGFRLVSDVLALDVALVTREVLLRLQDRLRAGRPGFDAQPRLVFRKRSWVVDA